MTGRLPFSICISAYKSRHLKDCLESILSQTVADFELIVLNDHSPEPVADIVHSFSDARIRYYENDINTGALRLVHNWNKCLWLAGGEYIMIMGDDDLLEPDYLEEFQRLIGAHPGLEVYHCRSQIIDDKGTTRMLSPACPAYEDVYDAIWHRINRLRSSYISDFVYKTDGLKERGGFYDLPLAWGSDDITAFVAAAEKGIAHSHRAVFKYRSHGLSISTTSSNGLHKLKADAGYADWLRKFLEKRPDHLRDDTVYQHLVQKQDEYMQSRRRFTMTKLLQASSRWNAWRWYRHRRELDLTVKDIAVALLKSLGRRIEI
jgi:glycosyltransferase involved in cell wall biosynthesis